MQEVEQQSAEREPEYIRFSEEEVAQHVRKMREVAPSLLENPAVHMVEVGLKEGRLAVRVHLEPLAQNEVEMHNLVLNSMNDTAVDVVHSKPMHLAILAVTPEQMRAMAELPQKDHPMPRGSMTDASAAAGVGGGMAEWMGTQAKGEDGSRYDKLYGGCQIQTQGINEVGTLGCTFKDKATGNTYLLSNAHVMLGSSLVPRPNATICQNVYDLTSTKNMAGTLVRTTINNSTTTAKTDAAIALLGGSRPGSNSILDMGVIYGSKPYTGTTTFTLGTKVWKRGRTTQLTKGSVVGVGVTVNMRGSSRVQTDCIRIQTSDGKPFSAGGDSGSVIVDSNMKIGALLFGGSDQSTVACTIQNVETDLGVTISPL